MASDRDAAPPQTPTTNPHDTTASQPPDAPAAAQITVSPATGASDLAHARTLFAAYAASLGVDLAFQAFAAELAGLPGAYAPSAGGALLLARAGAARDVVGCVALRRLPPPATPTADGGAGDAAPPTAELKRLYARPAQRGRGAGAALVAAALRAARALGYARVRLDTLPDMAAARALYARLGFERCGRYYETPLAGTVFLEKWL